VINVVWSFCHWFVVFNTGIVNIYQMYLMIRKSVHDFSSYVGIVITDSDQRMNKISICYYGYTVYFFPPSVF